MPKSATPPKSFEAAVSELEAIVAQVVADNPVQVEQYRGGKQQVIGFFVGKVMKASGGRANPQVVNDLLRRALDA